MSQLTSQDLIALENSAQSDPRVMGLIATMTPEQCKAMAQQSINRRTSFIFDLLSNEALLAITKGELNMAQTCHTMLAPRY